MAHVHPEAKGIRCPKCGQGNTSRVARGVLFYNVCPDGHEYTTLEAIQGNGWCIPSGPLPVTEAGR